MSVSAIIVGVDNFSMTKDFAHAGKHPGFTFKTNTGCR